MPTMIVRVNLKEGVSPEEYGPWILVLRPGGDGPPFSRRLARLQGSWSARVAHPPYQYVVTLEIKDPKQPWQNIASQEMQRHFYQLYRSAEITQLISDRFA